MPPSLHEKSTPAGQRHIAVDGKALHQSLDDFCDRKAAHIRSSFASDAALVLAHLDCDEKSNENPRSQALLRQPGLEQPCTVKKGSRRPQRPVPR